MKTSTAAFGRIRQRKSLYLLSGLALFFLVLSLSPLPQFLERQVTLPAEFWLRSQMGLDPTIDPRLKIIAYDDETAARIKALDLPLGDWGLFLHGLAKAKPAMIVIDKLFDKTYPKAQVERFKKTMAEVDVPIYTIAFVSDEIPFRSKAAAEQWQAAWTKESRHVGKSVYAADPRIVDSFTGVGHALYDGDGRIQLMVGLGNGVGIPHVSLRPFGEFVDEIIKANGVQLPGGASVIVNLPDPDSFTQYSLLGILSRAVRNTPLEVIKEDDVLLILPAMYTGNTDWRQTQHGSVPGGLINAAVLNSILSKQWVTEFGSAPLLVLFGCLLGYLTLLASTLSRMLISIFVATSVAVLLPICAFVLGGVHIDWILPSGTILVTGIVFYAERFRVDQLDKLRIALELGVATAVQDSLRVANSNEDSKIFVQTYSRPSSECSGDWSGHFEPIPGCHYIAIADATGHGTGAALVSAMAFSAMALQMHLIASKGELLRPADIVCNINEALAKSSSRRTTMTLCVALVESAKGTVTVSSGAHVFPLMIKPAGAEGKQVRPLQVPGTVVGLAGSEEFSQKEFPLVDGDSLVFFTDGLFECKNPNDEELGKRAGRRLLKEGTQAQTPPNLDEIIKRVNRFFGDETVLDDDLTIVMATYLGDASTSKVDETPS